MSRTTTTVVEAVVRPRLALKFAEKVKLVFSRGLRFYMMIGVCRRRVYKKALAGWY